MQAFARTPFGGWLFINVFPLIDRWLMPLTHGRVKVAIGQPILLLHSAAHGPGSLEPPRCSIRPMATVSSSSPQKPAPNTILPGITTSAPIRVRFG